MAGRRVSQGILAATALAAAVGLGARKPAPAPVAVRYTEGITHGFLTLRTLEGTPLADGDLIQNARADEVTSRIVLRFRDGSLQDETVVFSQRGHFRLLSDHLVQKGPSFPKPLDVAIEAPRGVVTVRYTDDGGEEKLLTEHLDLPEDLANGMVIVMIKNLGSRTPPPSVSMVATAPKPRIVRLIITPAGEDAFSIGSSRRKAVKYAVKVDLGGIAGTVAPLIGKQPQDTYVWITGGEAPTFLKSEGPFYVGGPSWRLELTTPSWTRTLSGPLRGPTDERGNAALALPEQVSSEREGPPNFQS
jgi:hypothetical protein